ncbi:MAG: hypothetical protein ACK45R_02210 [Candidatus Kapaibacterium sp.]|jgi:hypothetical protein
MSRVMFTVSYSIAAESMPTYNELVRRLTKANAERGLEYFVFRKRNNEFTEVTIYADQEAFDQADDMMEDEIVGDYIARINAIAQDVSYETLTEVDPDNA